MCTIDGNSRNQERERKRDGDIRFLSFQFFFPPPLLFLRDNQTYTFPPSPLLHPDLPTGSFDLI